MDPYEFNSQAYKESQWRPDDPRVQRIVPLVGNNQTVLDLGCLDGTIGGLFVRNGNILHGIDASRSALPRALERGIKVELGNLEEPLKHADKAFDVVFAGEIVEHVFDIDSLLSEIHRVRLKRTTGDNVLLRCFCPKCWRRDAASGLAKTAALTGSSSATRSTQNSTWNLIWRMFASPSYFSEASA